MELKEYQNKVIGVLKNYLSSLSDEKQKYEEVVKTYPDLAKDLDYTKKAWDKAVGSVYTSHTNSLKEPLPDVYLKVPTGGGKTLLACHAIDLVNKIYLKRQTGLVLWVVPSTQIYRQTLANLRNREHPYRQVLDISSGGRTSIKEKMEVFNRLDVEENLVILLLMLPSANRKDKETLKVFKDSGGYTDFFPAEDDYTNNKLLLERIHNLDTFDDAGGIFNHVVKTSLGNTLKVLRPLVIIDEGHKAYSEGARDTIRNFNPSIIVELSATPPDNANKLVEISGIELNNEEMIKLDIHIINKTSIDWKNTMLASHERRVELEKYAKKYGQNTGQYIRPINLIQVERTGKDQRDSGLIHAEDVKEYLIKKCAISEDQIAIKSSEKDDIEGLDLLDPSCPVRYIITKQALQEGWDCPFAYILTILTNPSSQLSITQLVGRILRQPYARKTKIRELDESYVFCYKQKAVDVVKNIKNGLESEGLGDLAGRVTLDGGDNAGGQDLAEREIKYRDKFKKFSGKIYLPKFVVREGEKWRDVIFDVDILGNIDWSNVELKGLNEVELSKKKELEQELVYGLSSDNEALLEEHDRKTHRGTLEIDEVFLTRHLVDIVPNPWIAFELGSKALQLFMKKYDRDIVASNFVFIIEEIRKVFHAERDRLAESVFRGLIQKGELKFFLLMEKGGSLPSRINIRSNKKLIRNDNSEVQLSLFDYVPEESLNDLEKAVALYLDDQEKLLWWYRNISRVDYSVQGWKRNKIYPDFIAALIKDGAKNTYGSVHVLETKGLHLKNEDTEYKNNVFKLCNDLSASKSWAELFEDFADKDFKFHVIFEDEWKSRLNKIVTAQ
ncbi:MAG TPA: DEAD/DEAH box helicase family protein [Spirochaetota bacterium]|nr:DEAD/DEAH box helicase family protein [Spirochaetota bacterium]HNT12993.1 DEAD/DEAH box helicase family protein [Spirochaetota bacterium]